jgi:hypothetical protein
LWKAVCRQTSERILCGNQNTVKEKEIRVFALENDHGFPVLKIELSFRVDGNKIVFQIICKKNAGVLSSEKHLDRMSPKKDLFNIRSG